MTVIKCAPVNVGGGRIRLHRGKQTCPLAAEPKTGGRVRTFCLFGRISVTVTGTRADNIMGMHSTDREIERQGRILEAEADSRKGMECTDRKS